MRVILLLGTLALMGGCAALDSVEERIVSGVERYCAKVLPGERELIRGRVNAGLAPAGHAVRVTCRGDVE